MKNNATRHYNLAWQYAVSANAKKISRKPADAAKARPVCTREQWIKLNQLGKTRPFCSWHRQRNNDPL